MLAAADIGMFALDVLDTLWLMDLSTEVKEAASIVRQRFDITKCARDVPVSEVLTRIVGGLMAAYDITKSVAFLDAALAVVDKCVLLPGRRPLPHLVV